MTTMSDRINTRIDPKLKSAALQVFEKLGLNEGEAIRMFYAQVNLNQGLPFDVKIPNTQTLKALKESSEDMTSYSLKEFRESLS